MNIVVLMANLGIKYFQQLRIGHLVTDMKSTCSQALLGNTCLETLCVLFSEDLQDAERLGISFPGRV